MMKQKQIALPLTIFAALGLVVSLSGFADNNKAEAQTIQSSQSTQEIQSENSDTDSQTATSSQTIGSAWPGPL